MARSVLILVVLNPDNTDISGFKYPASGNIESLNYRADHNIMNGFYGTLWASTSDPKWFNPDPDGKWCVARTDQNEEFVVLDKEHNLVKFRRGNVTFSGSREECCKNISMSTPVEIKCNVAHRIEESQAKEQHVFVKGARSRAVTLHPDSYAVNAGVEGISRVAGSYSCAVSLGYKGECDSTGENSSSVVFGNSGKATSMGNQSKAVTLQHNSLVAAGQNGVAIALSEESKGMVGDNGVLILAYNNEDGKQRFQVGYSGENIKPNILYRVNNKGVFETV